MEKNSQKAFEQINELLADTDYPVRITAVGDIEDFLLDDDNRRLEQYPAIGRIFDELRGRSETGFIKDVSKDMEAETPQYPEADAF